MSQPILIVDDVGANRRLLRALLEREGHETIEVDSAGAAALEIALTGRCDLVLLDVQMPGMNGYEVCRRIRESPVAGAIPVVMVTAASSEERVSAYEAGADDIIHQPVDKRELLARVQSLLRIRAFHETVLGQREELAALNEQLEAQVRKQDEHPAIAPTGLASDGSAPLGDPHPITVRVLGSLVLRGDVELRSPRERVLLARLALEAGRSVPVDDLAADLWPEVDGAVRALRVHVSRLRRTLSDAGFPELLVTRSSAYALEASRSAVDAAVFEDTVAHASDLLKRGDLGEAVDQFRAAEALWRGETVEGHDRSVVIAAEAARLTERRLVATADRIDAELALGREHDVVAELDALRHRHPTRERFCAQLMLALHRCGRQADSLRAYQEFRRHLGDELGLEPSNDLRQLEAAIVQRLPELDEPISTRF